MNRNKFTYGPLVLVLLLVATGCGNREEGIYPIRQDITESVYASVTVQPDSMYRVHSAVSGILEKNQVSEGDRVHPGSVLMQVTARSPELNTENARLQMELATDKYLGEATPLRDLAMQIETTELIARDDSLNFVRQQRLWSQQIGSQSAYESRKLAYERSRNQLRQLRSEYRRLEEELRTAMEQSRNSYRSSLATKEEFTVRSTLEGKVYALYKEPGELVIPNEPLATIGKPDSFVMELLVDEVDIVRLEEGQQVLITLDAYGEEVFEAKLTKIYPQKDERNQTFLAEARLADPPARLYPGLSGEASIVIAQRDSVLTIPREYLIGPDQVRTASGIRKVTTGLQTLDRVEIRDGLDARDLLLKPEQ